MISPIVKNIVYPIASPIDPIGIWPYLWRMSPANMTDDSEGPIQYINESTGELVTVPLETVLSVPGLGIGSVGVIENLLANPTVPANQTTGSLSLGEHTLEMSGTGSVAISANSAVITGAGSATDGSPLTFEVISAGSVDIVITGDCSLFQLTATPYSLYPLFVDGLSATRAGTASLSIEGKVLDTFDGKADGDLESSGNLVAVNRYEVISTEADHFGVGVVVGDRITGLTTALDVNNTVKQISPAYAVIELDCTPGFDWGDIPNSTQKVIITPTSGNGLLSFRRNSLGDALIGFVILGAVQTVVPLEWQKDTTYPLRLVYGWNEALSGYKMQLQAKKDGVWLASAIVDFVGTFDPGEELTIGYSNDLPQWVNNCKARDLRQSDWKVAT